MAARATRYRLLDQSRIRIFDHILYMWSKSKPGASTGLDVARLTRRGHARATCGLPNLGLRGRPARRAQRDASVSIARLAVVTMVTTTGNAPGAIPIETQSVTEPIQRSAKDAVIPALRREFKGADSATAEGCRRRDFSSFLLILFRPILRSGPRRGG